MKTIINKFILILLLSVLSLVIFSCEQPSGINPDEHDKKIVSIVYSFAEDGTRIKEYETESFYNASDNITKSITHTNRSDGSKYREEIATYMYPSNLERKSVHEISFFDKKADGSDYVSSTINSSYVRTYTEIKGILQEIKNVYESTTKEFNSDGKETKTESKRDENDYVCELVEDKGDTFVIKWHATGFRGYSLTTYNTSGKQFNRDVYLHDGTPTSKVEYKTIPNAPKAVPNYIYYDEENYEYNYSGVRDCTVKKDTNTEFDFIITTKNSSGKVVSEVEYYYSILY